MTDTADALSEATKLGILQGRFEALQQGAGKVEPVHLILGILQTLDATQLRELGIDSDAIAAACVRLGGSTSPADLSPGDIDYSEACHVLVGAAIDAAGPAAATAGVDPAHLLLAAHLISPPADTLAPALADVGITTERIAGAIATRDGGR